MHMCVSSMSIFYLFDDKVELFEAIRPAWKELDPNLLKKLVKSMSRRCIQVINHRDGLIRHQ